MSTTTTREFRAVSQSVTVTKSVTRQSERDTVLENILDMPQGHSGEKPKILASSETLDVTTSDMDNTSEKLGSSVENMVDDRPQLDIPPRAEAVESNCDLDLQPDTPQPSRLAVTVLERHEMRGSSDVEEGCEPSRRGRRRHRLHEIDRREQKRSQSLPGMFTDEEVDRAVFKLKAAEPWLPPRPSIEPVDSKVFRKFVWDSIHFFPDIHLIDNSELLRRRHQYLQSLQALRQRAQENMETETVNQINDDMQKLTDELNLLPPGSVGMEYGAHLDIPQADSDSDSESYSPKMWRKNPLVVRKTKKVHDSRTNGHSVGISSPEGSDEEDTQIRQREERRYKRKGSSSPKINGRAPRKAEMQEMLAKFEELKQKRLDLKSASEESLPKLHREIESGAHVTDRHTNNIIPYHTESRPSRDAHLTTTVVAEIRENIPPGSERLEILQPVVRSGATEPSRGKTVEKHMDFSYSQNVTFKRKLPEQYSQHGALPSDQYDFRRHVTPIDGARDYITGPHSKAQYTKLGDDAPIKRISSFENIYNKVDLNAENPPMNRVEYEPRAKVPRNKAGQPHMGRQQDNSIEDTISELMDLASGTSSENLAGGGPSDSPPVRADAGRRGRPDSTSTTESPISPFGEGITQPYSSDHRRQALLLKKEKLLGSTSSGGSAEDMAQVERSINRAMQEISNVARRPQWGAAELLREEHLKYKEYKREYVRRRSERSESEDDRHSFSQDDMDREEGRGHGKVIPPDEYEYILRRQVVHQRQDAMYGGNYGRKFQLTSFPKQPSSHGAGSGTPSSPLSDREDRRPLRAGQIRHPVTLSQPKPLIITDHVKPGHQGASKRPPSKENEKTNVKAYIQRDTSWIKRESDTDDHYDDHSSADKQRRVPVTRHKSELRVAQPVDVKPTLTLSKDKSSSTPHLDYTSGIYITAVYEPKRLKAEPASEPVSPMSDTAVGSAQSTPRDYKKAREKAWHWPVRPGSESSHRWQHGDRSRDLQVPIQESMRAHSESYLDRAPEYDGHRPAHRGKGYRDKHGRRANVSYTSAVYKQLPPSADKAPRSPVWETSSNFPPQFQTEGQRHPYRDPRYPTDEGGNTYPRTSPTRTVKDRRHYDGPYPDPRLRQRGPHPRDDDRFPLVSSGPYAGQVLPNGAVKLKSPDQFNRQHEREGGVDGMPLYHQGYQRGQPSEGPAREPPPRPHSQPPPELDGLSPMRADPRVDWVNRSLQGHYRQAGRPSPYQLRPRSQPTAELALWREEMERRQRADPRLASPGRRGDPRPQSPGHRGDLRPHSPGHTDDLRPQPPGVRDRDRYSDRPTSQAPGDPASEPPQPYKDSRKPRPLRRHQDDREKRERSVERVWQSTRGPPPGDKEKIVRPRSASGTRDQPARGYPTTRDSRQIDWDRHIPRSSRPTAQQGLHRSGSEPDMQGLSQPARTEDGGPHPAEHTVDAGMVRPWQYNSSRELRPLSQDSSWFGLVGQPVSRPGGNQQQRPASAVYSRDDPRSQSMPDRYRQGQVGRDDGRWDEYRPEGQGGYPLSDRLRDRDGDSGERPSDWPPLSRPEERRYRPDDRDERGRPTRLQPRPREPVYGRPYHSPRSQSAEGGQRQPYRMSEEVRRLALESLGQPSVDRKEPIYKPGQGPASGSERPARTPVTDHKEPIYRKPDQYRRSTEAGSSPNKHGRYPGQGAHGYHDHPGVFPEDRGQGDYSRPDYATPRQTTKQPQLHRRHAGEPSQYSPAEKIIQKYKEARSPPVDRQIEREQIYAFPQKLVEKGRPSPAQQRPDTGSRHTMGQDMRIQSGTPYDQPYEYPETKHSTNAAPVPVPVQHERNTPSRDEGWSLQPITPIRDQRNTGYYEFYCKKEHKESFTDPYHGESQSVHAVDKVHYVKPGGGAGLAAPRPEHRHSGHYDDRHPPTETQPVYRSHDRSHDRPQPSSQPRTQHHITVTSGPSVLTATSSKKVPQQYNMSPSQEVSPANTNITRGPDSEVLLAQHSQPQSQQLQPDKEQKMPSQVWREITGMEASQPEPVVEEPQQVSVLRSVQQINAKVAKEQAGGTAVSDREQSAGAPTNVREQVDGAPVCSSGSSDTATSPSKRSIVTVKVPGQSLPKAVDASFHTPSEADQEFHDEEAKRNRDLMFRELKGLFEGKMTKKETKPEIEHTFIKWAPPTKKTTSTFSFEPHPQAKITPKDYALPVVLKGKEPEGPTLYSAREMSKSTDDIDKLKEDGKVDLNAIKENLFGPEGEKQSDATVLKLMSVHTKKAPARPKSPWEAEMADEYLQNYASYKDSLHHRRPQIHDQLTELEQIYDGLHLENEEDGAYVPQSAFRPVLRDRTHHQNVGPNSESLSMEYVKQWLITDGGNESPKGVSSQPKSGAPQSSPKPSPGGSEEPSHWHSLLKSPSVASTASSLQGKRPRKIGDDMAYRKIHPPVNGTSQDALSQVSYLMVSPKMTPSGSHENVQKDESPDAKLGHMPSKTSADYLEPRFTDPQRARFRGRPEKDADKYHDDLAYRNLRKDLPPVVVRLPGLADLHSHRLRSKSLENVGKDEEGTRKRSASVGKEEGKARKGGGASPGSPKLPVSSGVARMVKMFSGATQSAPDLTQGLFSSKYDEFGNLIQEGSKPGSSSNASQSQPATSKLLIQKAAAKQTVRGVKQKNEKKSKQKAIATPGEPDEASLVDSTESDSPASTAELQRSSPDGAIESDQHKQGSSPKHPRPAPSADSDSGFRSANDVKERLAAVSKPTTVPNTKTFSLALTSKTKVPSTMGSAVSSAKLAPGAKKTSAPSIKPGSLAVKTSVSSMKPGLLAVKTSVPSTKPGPSSTISNVGLAGHAALTGYTPQIKKSTATRTAVLSKSERVDKVVSPFKPIDPGDHPSAAESDFGPESMEVQNITTKKLATSPDRVESPRGISSPLTKVALMSSGKSLIKPKFGLLQPKKLPQSVRTTDITRDVKTKTTTVRESVSTTSASSAKKPGLPVSAYGLPISHDKQDSQDSEQLSLADLMERTDDDASDVESLAMLVAKQGILSPAEDFTDFSDYENIRSSPETPRAVPIYKPVASKPPKTITQQQEIVKPKPVSAQESSPVKLRGEGRRRTVEVMLKPDDKPSKEPALDSTSEKSDRPKSFHELVAGFEAQASPLFRTQRGVWKELRKVNSEERLHGDS